MATITMEVKKCSECPKCKVTRLYTEDSWEHADDYWCTATPAESITKQGRSALPFRLIKGYVEWASEIPDVPEWCPLASPSYKKKKASERLI